MLIFPKMMTDVCKVSVILKPSLCLIMLCMGRELSNGTEFLFLIKQELSLLAYIVLAI